MDLAHLLIGDVAASFFLHTCRDQYQLLRTVLASALALTMGAPGSPCAVGARIRSIPANWLDVSK